VYNRVGKWYKNVVVGFKIERTFCGAPFFFISNLIIRFGFK